MGTSGSPVLIVQIDDISLEALQRGRCDFLDVRGPAIQPGLFAGVRINFPSELRGDHNLLMEGSEGFAHEFFVRERAIDLRRIEERDAAFDGCSNQRDPFLLVHGRAVAETSKLLFPSSRFCIVSPPKVSSMIKSVACFDSGRLPIPPEYLLDPPRLLPD